MEIEAIQFNIFTAPRRRVRKVFVHCSASDHAAHDDVSAIREWHVKENGWNDVGYHYFIRSDGEIQKGRDINKAPAAQFPHNSGTIAVCLHGDKRFTDAQFKSLRTLCNLILDALPHATFHGHCEVNKNKTCPNFDYRKVLNLDADGRVLNRKL